MSEVASSRQPRYLVTDVTARRVLEFISADTRTPRRVTIRIGRPRRDRKHVNGDWVCPYDITGMSEALLPQVLHSGSIRLFRRTHRQAGRPVSNTGVGLILFNSDDTANPQFQTRVRAARHEPDMFYVNRYMKLLDDELFS